MMNFRPLFFLLLAANIVLGVLTALPMLGFQLPWMPRGEADRLTRQLVPENIRILSNEAPATPQAVNQAPAATQQAHTDPSTIVCVALRNLDLVGSQQLSDQAGRQGEGLTVRLSGVAGTSYWVNIPPGGGKEGATKRAETLVKAGIEDYIIVRDAGPNQYAISLGLFRSEEAANRLIEQLKKKNIKTARITVRDNTGNNARAEINGRSDLLEPFIKDFMSTHPSAQQDACSTN
jgi:hypothetical protein